jgi:hypothetical protein
MHKVTILTIRGQNMVNKAYKDTMKLGIASMAGSSVLGAMGGVTGAPAGIANTANAGLGLLNVGQLAKTGMGVANMTASGSRPRKDVKSKNCSKGHTHRVISNFI